MPPRYQPVASPRFRIVRDAGGEHIRIAARRQWFALLFLPVWLTGWTIGGGAAILALFTEFQLFLLVWLIGWAAGWLFAAGTIAWMLAGAETIRVTGGDLEIAHRIAGLSRRWLYRGGEVRRLRAAEASAWPMRGGLQVPLLPPFGGGALRFDYGARTIHVAPSLDAAEARLIVDWLAARLPRTAIGPA
jgi:hypothetical protein